MSAKSKFGRIKFSSCDNWGNCIKARTHTEKKMFVKAKKKKKLQKVARKKSR